MSSLKRDKKVAARKKHLRATGQKRQVMEKSLVKAFLTMPKISAETKS